jgi:hypothetical protein
LAVVVTFFADGGQPVMAGSWIFICPVPVVSRENIVAGENQAVWRGNGDGLHHYFNEVIAYAMTVDSLVLLHVKPQDLVF